jgi:hypothetical protein
VTRAIFACLLALMVAWSVACRRENPATVRAATAAAVAAANEQATVVVATTSAVAEATVSSGTSIRGTARRARVAAGNLGVAATGISAGIQLWSRPGGVLAGGATMTGTVTDGAEVDVIEEAEFLGQKYYQIRDSSKEGWVDGRFLQLE